MMSFNNLEHSFADLYAEIKSSYNFGNYQKTMQLCEKGTELCKRLYEEATDPAKKELWKKNFMGLKQFYSNCKEILSSRGELPLEDTSQKQTRSKSEGVARLAPENNAKPMKEYQTPNYTINGIDVQQFLSSEASEDVDFDNVIGMENEKKIIRNEFFLSDEEKKFKEHLGIKNKNFILLYGVPGTGKTYFATAISNELKKHSDDNVCFFNIKSGSIVDSKVGQSEKNIAAVFDFAKQFDRCVLFFDEFDALVPDRNQDTGNPVSKTNVTTFLQMIDGFNSGKGILVIAATNFPDSLDGAILSRANEKIDIPLPTVEVLYGMLDQKIGKLIIDDVDLYQTALRLIGYSSRDVKMFCEKLKSILFEQYQSRIYGEDFSQYKITNEIINDAISQIRPSTKKSDLMRIERYKSLGE